MVRFVKMSWGEAIFNKDDILPLPMHVCMKMECNEKLLVPKWNSLEINAKKRRNEVQYMKCVSIINHCNLVL
jgi:hypothetical protein